MEEDIDMTIKDTLEARVEKRLGSAIDKAEEIIHYEAAHNSELLRALDVVKKCIKTQRRVCYGGTAMNAILPPKHRFYNPDLDLPDYDFFTPDAEADVSALVKVLTAGGFKDVYQKVGMHEGTRKIMVNFSPIADITAISKGLYDIMLERSFVREGIRYTDPDMLRMMMYLELSHPKGEVDRWKKVYQRLQLINQFFPAKKTMRKATARLRGSAAVAAVPKAVTRSVIDYCIDEHRILFTGPLDTFYARVINNSTKSFHPDEHSGVIGFLSSEVKKDAAAVSERLGATTETLYHPAKGEIVPPYVEIRHNGKPVVLIFQEVACHAYMSFIIPADGRSIAIASLDTLINLYYIIDIFTTRAKHIIEGVSRKIPKFIDLVEKNRAMKNPHIPGFPISCHGYQKGYATLLREKVGRIKRAKESTTSLTRKRKVQK